MKTIFVYHRFLDPSGNEREIGGIETYLWNLSKVSLELGMEPVVVQRAAKEFHRRYDHLEIYGVDTNQLSSHDSRRLLFQKANSMFDKKRDIVIFGADFCSLPTDNRRMLSIQHGVFWDVPFRLLSDRKVCKFYVGQLYVKFRIQKQAVDNFNNCYNRVCVDYNFLNWYRATCVKEPIGRVWIVPNFVNIDHTVMEARENRKATGIRVIFARRFVEERGTKLVAHVALRLLHKFSNLSFSFAGTGPDREYLDACFKGVPEINFLQYLPDEVQKVLIDYDIALIPSLGSEGTSLSVAEAMGAGLPVIASAVGGITNMIIDGFNGMLAMPTEEDLFDKLEQLVTDQDLRKVLGRNAYETAKKAFSSTRWADSWKNILSLVAQE